MTMDEWATVFNRHRKNGCDLSDAAFRADQWEKRKHAGRWAHCSSTHCERAQECRGPNDCAASLKTLNEAMDTELMDKVWKAYWQEEPTGTQAALERVVATVIACVADPLRDGLRAAADKLESLSYIHDGNPSDAMADLEPVDYARHMLFEARQMAKEAHSEARESLTSAGFAIEDFGVEIPA